MTAYTIFHIAMHRTKTVFTELLWKFLIFKFATLICKCIFRFRSLCSYARKISMKIVFFRNHSQKYTANEGGMSHHTVLIDKLELGIINSNLACGWWLFYLILPKDCLDCLVFPCKMEAIFMYPPLKITVDWLMLAMSHLVWKYPSIINWNVLLHQACGYIQIYL